MAYLDTAEICSKVEELVFKLRGRLPVDVLTDQVHKFVGVLVKIKHFCATFSLLRAGIQGKILQKLEGPMKWEKYAFMCLHQSYCTKILPEQELALARCLAS